jgi:methylamine utilization protein MauE
LAMLNSKLAIVGDYRLVPIAENRATVNPIQRPLRRYYPLILIFLYILGVSLVSQHPMNTFMAGFFLVFSGFKLLDLPGFANAYTTYDILAKRWRGYGFVYPFLELALGVAYLIHWQSLLIYILTIVIMGFSSLGVIGALTKKQQIQCACLGTVLNLPMTVVTLMEDLLMVMMAVIMLLI